MKSIDELEKLIKDNTIVVVYFTGTDCNVCKSLKPKVEALLEEFSEVKAAYIYIDKMPAASGKYSVFAVPTVVCFVEGKETFRMMRSFSINELGDKIRRYIELLK